MRSIKLNIEGKTKEAVFTELAGTIAEAHPEFSIDKMLAVLWARENKMNTSVLSGVALPHGYYPGTGNMVGAIGVSQTGIEYDALDHKPVHFIFLIILGETSRENHLGVLSHILSFVHSGALAAVKKAGSREEVYTILSRFK
jgi:mannitol/fructose-specific phosphotransferase system IIA component (Ntr-type)